LLCSDRSERVLWLGRTNQVSFALASVRSERMPPDFDTTSQIKPIETQYKGYRFRSRLEARWAVFFDELEIKWEYESEGFECRIYENKPPIKYLPDFYLPSTETWVEVKGSSKALLSDKNKLESILDWESPIPNIMGSYDNKLHGKTHGLIILGNIPDAIHGMTLHPIVQHHKGLIWSWCLFDKYSIDVFHYDHEVLHYFTREPEEWNIDFFQIPTKYASVDVTQAYRSARQARFEHGESP